MHHELIGQVFNKLTVVSYKGYSESSHTTLWECLCGCGNTKTVSSGNLKTGHTKSCGCYQVENRGKHSLVHGHTTGRKSSSTYNSWQSMRNRCGNPKHEKYHYYGGRGIKVCGRWKLFKNFLEDMREAPEGTEIDRKNNELGYSKKNCQWVTKSINARNKRNNLLVVYENKLVPLISVSEKYNIPIHALRRRVRDWGMSLNEALESCKKLRKKGINKRNVKKNGIYPTIQS